MRGIPRCDGRPTRSPQAKLRTKKLREAKYRLLERMKAANWTNFEAGMIGAWTYNQLMQILNDKLDTLQL